MRENQKTTLVAGLEVVKWGVEKIGLDLSRSKFIDPLLPAKIAFEFLALCTGTAIYTQDWPFCDLREMLRSSTTWNNNILHVERLNAGDARPFHGICDEDNPVHAQIQIRLFGCLAYRVRFPGLHVEGPRYVYTHDLSAGEEHVTTMK